MSYIGITDLTQKKIRQYELEREIAAIESQLIDACKAYGMHYKKHRYSGQPVKVIELLEAKMRLKTTEYLKHIS